MKQQTRSSNSKQIGREISRLIGIAQKVKAQEKGNNGEPEAQEYDPITYWRNQAKQWAQKAAVAQQKAAETRRQRLANFSLADIEAELQRRLTGK